MRIAVDLDNVTVATTVAVVDYINERLPINLKMEDIHDYYIENALPAQYKWIGAHAFEDKEMWKKVKVIPEAVEYLHKLYDEGYEIYFVTSSLPSNLHKKIKHLERNLDFFPKNYIKKYTINTSIKQIIRADILIDDCLQNFVGDREYFGICYKYPWNQWRRDRADLIRNLYENGFCYADNWQEIYKLIHCVHKDNSSNKFILS